MKLIVGLGNVVKGYERTRHNAGFLAVDQLANNYHGTWQVKKNLEAAICLVAVHGEEVLLAKPQTNMNDSGRAVKKLLAAHPKIDPKRDLIVLYDDVETALGVVKKKETGSAAGHNGIRSIIAHIGDVFCRVKIGVGRPAPGVQLSDFVLGSFTSVEMVQLTQSFDEVVAMVTGMIQESVAGADPKVQAKIKALAD